VFKIKHDLEKIRDSAYRQGKTKEQVKQLISVYLTESKRKMNKDKMID